MIDMKGCTVVRSAKADDLEMLTGSGWILLGVLTDSWVEMHHNEEAVAVPPAAPPPGGYGCAGTVERVFVSKSHKVHRPMFLLGMREESVLRSLQEDVAALREDLAAKAVDLEHIKKEADDLRRGKETLANELRYMGEAKRSIESDVVTERKLKAKLETDIAAIRKAIGDREVRRILEETGT